MILRPIKEAEFSDILRAPERQNPIMTIMLNSKFGM